MKKLNKKGFTLAELLIVVAIIAVLTAIAVPLFVGALNKAETNVQNANIRAVRGIAIEYILQSDETKDSTLYETNADGVKQLKKYFKATATVDSKGNVSNLEITAPTKGNEDKDSCTKTGGNYSVTVFVEELTVTSK